MWRWRRSDLLGRQVRGVDAREVTRPSVAASVPAASRSALHLVQGEDGARAAVGALPQSVAASAFVTSCASKIGSPKTSIT